MVCSPWSKKQERRKHPFIHLFLQKETKEGYIKKQYNCIHVKGSSKKGSRDTGKCDSSLIIIFLYGLDIWKHIILHISKVK